MATPGSSCSSGSGTASSTAYFCSVSVMLSEVVVTSDPHCRGGRWYRPAYRGQYEGSVRDTRCEDMVAPWTRLVVSPATAGSQGPAAGLVHDDHARPAQGACGGHGTLPPFEVHADVRAAFVADLAQDIGLGQRVGGTAQRQRYPLDVSPVGTDNGQGEDGAGLVRGRPAPASYRLEFVPDPFQQRCVGQSGLPGSGFGHDA